MATLIETVPIKLGNVIANQYVGTSNIISTATNSNVVVMPKIGDKQTIKAITVHLILTGDAVAKVQVTNDTRDAISADTNNWANWDVNGIGEDPLVSTSMMVELATAITGLRVVISSVTTGTAKIIVKFHLQ